jgi:hypothetical protein
MPSKHLVKAPRIPTWPTPEHLRVFSYHIANPPLMVIQTIIDRPQMVIRSVLERRQTVTQNIFEHRQTFPQEEFEPLQMLIQGTLERPRTVR